MARQKPNLELTPLMSLAILTLFALMIPLYAIVTRNYRVQQVQAVVTEPSPTPAETLQ